MDIQANQIGARLKEIRRTLDRTLAEVSQATGVSISNLSKIENNQISPSFDIMKRIGDGLAVSIEDFVRPGTKDVVSGRKTKTRRGEGDHFTSGQYDYRAHASELSRKAMVPLEIVVHARAVDEFDHWSQHRGEEFVQCVERRPDERLEQIILRPEVVVQGGLGESKFGRQLARAIGEPWDTQE